MRTGGSNQEGDPAAVHNSKAQGQNRLHTPSGVRGKHRVDRGRARARERLKVGPEAAIRQLESQQCDLEATVMPTSLNDNLPEVLKSVQARPLFVMRLDVRKLRVVGATP